MYILYLVSSLSVVYSRCEHEFIPNKYYMDVKFMVDVCIENSRFIVYSRCIEHF